MINMRTIRVTGKGQIKVKPDTTRITMTLEGTYPDYGEALRHSSLDTEQLKDVLSAFGFERSDLKTLNLDVETEYWRRKSQRNCCPFGILARFERNAHKGKMVCGHSFQNVKK